MNNKYQGYLAKIFYKDIKRIPGIKVIASKTQPFSSRYEINPNSCITLYT